QVYRVLSQIEEIIRFATPEHRLEIFRSLFREIIVKPDKTLDIAAQLPSEGVIQRLQVALRPSKKDTEEVYLNTWTLAFFAVLCCLTQKTMQDRPIIAQFGCFLAGHLQQGACMLIAVLAYYIGECVPLLLGRSMV